MGQAYFGLLPLHAFAFALVCLRAVSAYCRHHGAVHLDDEGLLWRYTLGQPKRFALVALADRLPMCLRDPPDRALGQHDAVVFDQFVHRFGIRQVGPKVGHGPLQEPRAAALAYLRTLGKGADALAGAAVLGLVDADVAKRGVPAKFFLPSRWARPVRRTSCSV